MFLWNSAFSGPLVVHMSFMGLEIVHCSSGNRTNDTEVTQYIFVLFYSCEVCSGGKFYRSKARSIEHLKLNIRLEIIFYDNLSCTI